MSTPVKIFIAFSHEDNALEKKLKTALNPLVRLGHATLWDDFSVESGSDWKATIMQNLLDSGVVLLLFSPDAIASPYFMEEVEVAIERHKNGEAVAVPVILRPCAWQRVPHIAELEALPEKALPVTKWADTDDAFLHLFEAVEKLVERPKAKLEGKSTTETADLFALREADPFHDQMVFIEGGKFDMGDTFGEGLNPEKPVHPVTVPSFWLQKTAVSQAQWMKFMDYNPSNWKGDNLPVENVNWEEAQAFIEKVNEKAGLKYRLPSEAEWEFAARERGKKVRFGNGKDILRPSEANFKAPKEYKREYSEVGEYSQKTVAVASFQPNSLGLFQMSGNVWEWCADHWHESYDGAPSAGSAWTTSGDSSRRVVRGGSWSGSPFGCRAVYRYCYYSGLRFSYVGFRLARN